MIITTEKYWDCECEYDYIHPKTEVKCKKCGYSQEECPDSRVAEVEKYFGSVLNRRFYTDDQKRVTT